MAATASPVVLPQELVVFEILVRLPVKELIRSRLVCRITATQDFHLAHHRHQPSLPLVSFHGTIVPPGNRRGVFDASVDAFDLKRRPVLRFDQYRDAFPYHIHASCDGLLLLSHGGGRHWAYYLMNPATRRWTSLLNLMKLRCTSNVLGMYPHGSSGGGEYRILYWNGTESNDTTPCHVFTVGSSEAPRDVANYRASGLCYVTEYPSVLLRRCLHWLHREGGRVLVFDAVGESFRWMRAPRDDAGWEESELAQLDGTLSISRINTGRTMMQLWMLQDYEVEVWSMKHQIKFPVDEMSSIANSSHFHGMVLSENGDVLVYCDRNSNMFHCDRTGKLLQKFQWDNVFSRPTRQWFKESLIRHEYLKRQNGRYTHLDCFPERRPVQDPSSQVRPSCPV